MYYLFLFIISYFLHKICIRKVTTWEMTISVKKNLSASIPLIHLLACELDGQYLQYALNFYSGWKIIEDNADFHKMNLLSKLLLIFCCSSISCLRAVWSLNSVPGDVLFVTFWSHGSITVVFLFLYFFLFIPHCCDSWVSILWHCTFAKTNEWCHVVPWEKREASIT